MLLAVSLLALLAVLSLVMLVVPLLSVVTFFLLTSPWLARKVGVWLTCWATTRCWSDLEMTCLEPVRV